jgi:hypothetical protein
MTQLQRTKTDTHSRPRCRRCGGAMRLYGIEAHPDLDGSILQTYVCERCDCVRAATLPASARNGSDRKKKAAPTVSLLANKAFDDATTSRLGEAYEAAWRKLKASGSPLADKSHAASTRERLAKCILDMGQRGETNSNRLVENALARLTSANGGAAPSSDH